MQYIVENASMGVVGINDVIAEITDEEFKKLLIDEKKEYEGIYDTGLEILRENNTPEKKVNPMAKIGSKIYSKMELAKKDATESIAKMMMEGTNKGIIAIQEKINSYSIKDTKIEDLAFKLKATLEHNVDDLKKYL